MERGSLGSWEEIARFVGAEARKGSGSDVTGQAKRVGGRYKSVKG